MEQISLTMYMLETGDSQKLFYVKECAEIYQTIFGGTVVEIQRNSLSEGVVEKQLDIK